MGAVYRAFDTKLRRKVALKVIHPDLAVPDAAARLVREARAAAALAHPNTVAIHDLGEIDGTVFLVMELVSGAPLRAYVGDTTVPVAEAPLARRHGARPRRRAQGRSRPSRREAHERHGVGRGRREGARLRLAKPLEAASFHTDVGLVVGTPRYMAPELFAGMRPMRASDRVRVRRHRLRAARRRLSRERERAGARRARTLVPEVGPAVARVIARTLSRAADARFATMNDVASALEDESSRHA